MREFFRRFVCTPSTGADRALTLHRLRWFRHEWPKWQEVGIARRYEYPDATDLSKRLIIGEAIVQHRRCERCGLLQSRKVKP